MVTVNDKPYNKIKRDKKRGEPTVEMLVGVSDGQAAEVAEGVPTLALHLVAALLFVEPQTITST